MMDTLHGQVMFYSELNSVERRDRRVREKNAVNLATKISGEWNSVDERANKASPRIPEHLPNIVRENTMAGSS
jgi:hypothetical protein